MQNNKQYGLIRLGQKSSTSSTKPARPSIFDDSSSDDEQGSNVPVYSSNLKKQTETKISLAVQEDPSIFQYDEVYEDIKQPAKKSNQNNVDKKPKYMNNLLKSAEMRKKEQELRLERKIQKEREQEGDEFQDKEAFVTNAYREKLEQMKKDREDFDNQEQVEQILDVSKQDNMNAFYRSMYKNSLFSSENTAQNDPPNDEVKFNKSTNQKHKKQLRERDLNDEEDEIVTKTQPEAVIQPTDLNVSSIEPVVEPAETPVSSHKPNNEPEEQTNNDTEDHPIEPAKPKLTREEIVRQLFTKRTVGEKFEERRRQYLIRKGLISV